MNRGPAVIGGAAATHHYYDKNASSCGEVKQGGILGGVLGNTLGLWPLILSLVCRGEACPAQWGAASSAPTGRGSWFDGLTMSGESPPLPIVVAPLY